MNAKLATVLNSVGRLLLQQKLIEDFKLNEDDTITVLLETTVNVENVEQCLNNTGLNVLEMMFYTRNKKELH